MPDIVGVGDTDVDVTIRVDHVPGSDEKVRGTLAAKTGGGIVANFCCAAARAGAETGVITVVGDDEYGRIALDDFRTFGVDISHVLVKNGMSTYFCVILLDPTGEKALTMVDTDIVVPSPAEVDVDYLRDAKFVHLTSLNFELANHVSHLSDRGSSKLSIDIEGHQDVKGIKRWASVIRDISIVFVNEGGMSALFDRRDLRSNAHTILQMGPETVVVTRGSEGCDVFTSSAEFHIDAFRAPVVDTTGAGDCFNANFLTALVNGHDLRTAALLASAAAAISIGAIGARGRLPTSQCVRAFLSERGY